MKARILSITLLLTVLGSLSYVIAYQYLWTTEKQVSAGLMIKSTVVGILKSSHPETLPVYQVHLDVYANFSTGHYLSTEFYSYSDISQANTTVWNGTTPADVVLSMDVSHPLDRPIEKVYLVLRDINMNKIQTITSFTMHRTGLFKRLVYLDGEWPYASPDERSAITNEITDIDIQWAYAPS